MADLQKALEKIDEIIAHHRESIEGYEELKRSLAHEAQDASGRPTVSYTKDKVARLRKAYRAAQDARIAEFEFEGDAYVTEYAKYLVEYLEARF